MNEELIAKAKQADSPEEIMKIAEENDIEMGKEEAEMIYKQLHTSGEVSDEELESVAGGGCDTSDGHTVVTSCCKCFNGQYLKNCDKNGKRIDFPETRKLWDSMGKAGCCGTCRHLEFTNTFKGYCGVS